MIYFDNAATTLIKPAGVAEAVSHAVKKYTDPGRGNHRAAEAAAEVAYNCREAAAEFFGVPSPEQIVFTMNATHALNIAIKSLASGGEKVVVSGYEHNSVVRPLAALGSEIVVAPSPLFDAAAALSAFEKALTPETKLAVVNYVSNAFGFILPVNEISRLCSDRNIPLIIDASQAAGHLPLDFGSLNAEFIAMPGHKGLFGPQGTGLLLCSDVGRTLIEGGSGSSSLSRDMPEYLPDRHEAGTHNMPGICGLLEGLRFVKRFGTDRIRRIEEELLDTAVRELSRIDGITVFAAKGKGTQSAVLSFTADKIDCNNLARKLSDAGAAVRAGLHCAPFAHQSAGTEASGTVRVSFSVFNTKREVKSFAAKLKRIVEE